MKEMTKEKQKIVDIDETQEMLFDTFLRLTRKYCEYLNNDINADIVGRHVCNLSLAVLALNGIDTYECNGEGSE